tara:strand:- start:1631 stop:2311 length:681 start_codon:yes stop_codon:yes gene_type:complete
MRAVLLIFMSILLFSCGGSDDDTPPIDNVAPTVPSLLVPNDEELCTDNPLDFEWTIATDPEGDNVQYEIQVATNNSFSADVQTKIKSITTHNFTLLKSSEYYWRVRSKDNKNNFSDYSDTRKYYTEGEGVSNHLPFTATLISPELSMDISDNTTLLKWSASDVDGDVLTYDVYFGKENPPILLVENISETTRDVDLLESVTYYWKIVVKDDKGGESIGQVWEFNAE